MPITPAIGLSVLIHFIAIIVGLISKLIHKGKKRKLKKTHSLSSNLISIPIVIMVFTVIMIGAGEMIKLCLNDSHSTLLIAKKQAEIIALALAQPSYQESLQENIANAYPSATDNMTSKEKMLVLRRDEVSNSPLGGKDILGTMITRADTSDDNYNNAQDDCQIDFYNFAAGNRWSIVNYLDAKDIDPSFENREKIAAEFGMADYEGTREQNMELLEKLFLKDVENRLANGTFCKL